MIEFIKENPYARISHPLFADDEYIYSRTDGLVYDESGLVFENWASTTDIWAGINGIRMRTGGRWENDWYIKEISRGLLYEEKV